MIRDQGPSTIDEIAKATGVKKAKLFTHLVAMRQFGKILIIGERDDQLVYGLPERKETRS
jgi:predicted transcriptional regulator